MAGNGKYDQDVSKNTKGDENPKDDSNDDSFGDIGGRCLVSAIQTERDCFYGVVLIK